MAQVQEPSQRLPQAAAAAACRGAWKALVHVVRVVAGRGRLIRALASPRKRVVPAVVRCLSVVACAVISEREGSSSSTSTLMAGVTGQQRKAAEPARSQYLPRSASKTQHGDASVLSGKLRGGQAKRGACKRSSQQCISRTAFKNGTALGQRHQRHVERREAVRHGRRPTRCCRGCLLNPQARSQTSLAALLPAPSLLSLRQANTRATADLAPEAGDAGRTYAHSCRSADQGTPASCCR